MKSKDLQKVVLSKYENGDGPTKICRDLNGCVSLATIKRWCQMIFRTGTIELSAEHSGPLLARTKENIMKVKKPFTPKKWSISSKTIDGARYFCNKRSANIKNRFRVASL